MNGGRIAEGLCSPFRSLSSSSSVYVGQCPRAHLAGVATVVADRFASILPGVSQSAICLFYPFPAPQDGQITALLNNRGTYSVILHCCIYNIYILRFMIYLVQIHSCNFRSV